MRRLLLIYRPRVSLRRGSGRAGGRSRTARVRWTMAWRDEGGEEGGRHVRSRAIDRGDRPSFEARGRVVGDRGPSSSRARGRPGRRGANAEASGRAPLPTALRAGLPRAPRAARIGREGAGTRVAGDRGGAGETRGVEITLARREKRERGRRCGRGRAPALRAARRAPLEPRSGSSRTKRSRSARRRSVGALEGAGMRRARGARALKKSRRKPSAEKHPRVQVGGLVATVRLTEHHAPE